MKRKLTRGATALALGLLGGALAPWREEVDLPRQPR